MFGLMPNTIYASNIAKNEDLEIQFVSNTTLQTFLDKTIDLKFKDENFKFETKKFVNWENNFAFQENYESEIEKSTICKDLLNLEDAESSSFQASTIICDLTKTIPSSGNIKKKALLKIDNKKLNTFISSLSEKIISIPTNAKIKVVEEKKENQKKEVPPELASNNENTTKNHLEITEPAKPGFKLDEEKTFEGIVKTLNDSNNNLSLQLPITEIAAEISKETLDDLKIETKIGHGESNFAGSPKNRIHNINVAVERFHGLLLSPNEEFSFTTILGHVDKETGYKEELVIKENKTIPEYGGGVCQVSTTVFRAALNTGLKITERKNHAYPVQYYSPQGTDATIYIPKPDLRFINNTPGYLLFQASVEGRILSFDIFGQSDGRVIEMEGPKVTERTHEGVLKVTLKQIVKNKEGELIFEDTFKSVYDNPAKYHEKEILDKKPLDWSNKQWKAYKKEHNL